MFNVLIRRHTISTTGKRERRRDQHSKRHTRVRALERITLKPVVTHSNLDRPTYELDEECWQPGVIYLLGPCCPPTKSTTAGHTVTGPVSMHTNAHNGK